MNKRIQELAEECTDWLCQGGHDPIEIFDKERFAQLIIEECEDIVSKALNRAWQLGQTYWAQADSESWKQNKKADDTYALFMQLKDETLEQLRECE